MRAFAIALWATALAEALPAHAQLPPAIELSWQAPDGCPDEAQVRAEAARALGTAPATSSPLVAEAQVERSGEGYVLHLRTRFEGKLGERRLEARDCHALMQSVTLVLGVLLGAEPSPEPAPAPALDPVPAPAPAPAPVPVPAPDEPTTAEPPRRPRPFALLLGAGLQLALMPEPAFLGLFGAELRLGALALGAQVQGSQPTEQQPATGVATRMAGLGGALLACYRWPVTSMALGLCAGARAAALRARGEGPAIDPSAAVAPWYALFAGADLTWPRDAVLGLRLWADAAVSLARPRFVVQGVGEVHRVPPVVGQLGLGLVWSP